MSRRKRSRRRYLMSVGVAGMVGLAGCSGSDDDRPGERFEEFPTLEADDPTYREWLPAGDDFWFGSVGAYNLAQYRELQSELSASMYEGAAHWVSSGDYFGVDFEEMEKLIVSLHGPGLIFPGEFDQSAIDETLRGTGYDQSATRDGVSFYQPRDADDGSKFAVGEEGVIEDHGGSTDEFVDEAFVFFETVRGERERQYERSDRFRRYTDDVGWPLFAIGGLRERFPSQIAEVDTLSSEIEESLVWGVASEYTDGTVVNRLWSWRTDDAVSQADIKEAVESAVEDSPEAETGEVAVWTDERVTEIALTEPIETGGGGEDPRQTSIRATIEGETLQLSHLAGDPVDLGQLEAEIGDEKRSLGDGQFGPGEELTVEIGDTDERIRIIDTSPEEMDQIVARAG